MLQSMTGFGKSTVSLNDKNVNVEIRSLNSKGLDVYLKLPSFYKEKELPIRKMIGDKLQRGKIECIVSEENAGDQSSVEINKDLVKRYFNDLKEVADEVGQSSSDLMATVMRMPDVFQSKEGKLEETEWLALSDAVSEALDQMVRFREQEGVSLVNDFNSCIDAIEELLSEVPKYESLRIDTIKERMRKALEKMEEKVDENRFEQELIYYIEKLDVSEEKTRLQHHLNYFRDTMKDDDANGKKLGFITQELGREINTLGSKSYHVELQKIVVQMKDYLEKIKEQVLNTL
ncbi:MAG: YicC/YloC family endoribonuclease [Brumimicrobium sp.]